MVQVLGDRRSKILLETVGTNQSLRRLSLEYQLDAFVDRHTPNTARNVAQREELVLGQLHSPADVAERQASLVDRRDELDSPGSDGTSRVNDSALTRRS